MAIAAPATACFALFVSILAAQLHSFLDHWGTTTTAQAFPLHGAAVFYQVLLLPALALMEAALFTAVSFVYPAAAADGNRRLSEFVVFIVCMAVGLLEFFLFVQHAGGVQARALGLAAPRALLASSAVTFFLGLALVYLHVGTGGVNGPVPEPAVRLLAEITLEAAASLIVMMAMAVYTL